EQRNTRFSPQSSPEEQWRISGRRQDRCGHRLSNIVKRYKFLGADLIVHLKARTTGFEHDRIMFHYEFVHAFEAKLVSAASQLIRRFANGEVARLWGHIA